MCVWGGTLSSSRYGGCLAASVQQMGSIVTAAASLCGELTHHITLCCGSRPVDREATGCEEQPRSVDIDRHTPLHGP